MNESMKEAAEEEKSLAVAKNSYHDGVPAISVIVDAKRTKQSHKHSYNAKSGVGIVIGLETNKLLHVSVRNKFCSICEELKVRARSLQRTVVTRIWMDHHHR